MYMSNNNGNHYVQLAREGKNAAAIMVKPGTTKADIAAALAVAAVVIGSPGFHARAVEAIRAAGLSPSSTNDDWREERAIFVDKLGMGDDWTCTEIMTKKGHAIGYWVDCEDKAHNARSRMVAALPALLDMLCEALPYVEEGEEFNKPTARTLSKKIRAMVERLDG